MSSSRPPHLPPAPCHGIRCCSSREEAQLEAAVEPLLSSFLYGSVLGQPSFEHSLAFMLANRLSNATMLPAQLFRIILQVRMLTA